MAALHVPAYDISQCFLLLLLFAAPSSCKDNVMSQATCVHWHVNMFGMIGVAKYAEHSL